MDKKNLIIKLFKSLRGEKELINTPKQEVNINKEKENVNNNTIIKAFKLSVFSFK